MLFSVAAAVVTFAALISISPVVVSSTEAPQQRASFPTQFIVSTGTTVPFPDIDPIAQSGSIYFDLDEQRMRIDNFWMGNQRSFIADLKNQRGYLINNAACFTSRLTGTLVPFGVPGSALRDGDDGLVRGVPVRHFSDTVRNVDHNQVVEYYVRRMNLTYTGEDGSPQVTSYTIPWRMVTHRSDRKELVAPPHASSPNWRFFGEPLHEDVVRFQSDNEKGTPLSRVVRDVHVTIDFYNFVPMVPDASVFEMPQTCREPPTETFQQDVDVAEIKQHLIDLTFNSLEGQRLMSRLWQPPAGAALTAGAKKAAAEGDL